MNKYLLLFVFLIPVLALQSQSTIVHTDFGDGLVVQLNEELAVDMDDNGVIDFYVNKRANQLGFNGVFSTGCFVGTSDFDFSQFGTAILRIFEEGELIEMNSETYSDYVEDGVSVYGGNEGHAEGWVDNEDYYVGMALLISNGSTSTKNAWMKISIDSEAETLTIKEWAYKPISFTDETGILAGSRGSLTSIDQLVDINEILVSPNPIVDRMNINYNYTGEEELTIGVYNAAGVEVFQHKHRDNNNRVEVDTEVWAAGSYIVRFQTSSGVKAKQVMIVR